MAELVGLVSSAIALAEFGFKLSVKLFAFSQAVSSASRDARALANEVSLASTVLRELASLLEADGAATAATAAVAADGKPRAGVASASALDATAATVAECLSVFSQIDEMLGESLARMEGTGSTAGVEDERDGDRGGDEKTTSSSLSSSQLQPRPPQPPRGSSKGKVRIKGAAAWERLLWPWRQSRLELLQGNLDRLKANLTLMLQVLSYARDVSSRQKADASLAYQQHVISSMAQLEKEMEERYRRLQDSIDKEVFLGLGPPPAYGTVNLSTNTAGAEDTAPAPARGEGVSPSIDEAPTATLARELLLSAILLDDVIRRQKNAGGGLRREPELVALLDEIQQREMRTAEDASFDRAVTALRSRLSALAVKTETQQERRRQDYAQLLDRRQSIRTGAGSSLVMETYGETLAIRARNAEQVITAPSLDSDGRPTRVSAAPYMEAPYMEVITLEPDHSAGKQDKLVLVDSPSGHHSPSSSNSFMEGQGEEEIDESEEDEIDDQRVVNDLLSQWTTIRLH